MSTRRWIGRRATGPEITTTTGPPDGEPGPDRWLVAFGLAYGVLHHQGFLFGGLGNVPRIGDGGTRLADWLDLLTPFLVLGPALMVLYVLGSVGRATWLVAWLGVVLYVEGHGIHLAANSIANEQVEAGGRPSPITHLWDEPVGHHLWFAGLALVVAAIVVAVHRRHALPRGPLTWLLALQFGLTWGTNGLEGGTAIFSGLVAAGFVAWALAMRRRGGEDAAIAPVLLWGFGPSLLMIAGYGILNPGFPQPSEIGWGVFG